MTENLNEKILKILRSEGEIDLFNLILNIFDSETTELIEILDELVDKKIIQPDSDFVMVPIYEFNG